MENVISFEVGQANAAIEAARANPWIEDAVDGSRGNWVEYWSQLPRRRDRRTGCESVTSWFQAVAVFAAENDRVVAIESQLNRKVVHGERLIIVS